MAEAPWYRSSSSATLVLPLPPLAGLHPGDEHLHRYHRTVSLISPPVRPWNVIKIPALIFFFPSPSARIMFTQVSIRRRIWLPNFSFPPWGLSISLPHMDTEQESRLLIIPQHTEPPRAHILKSHIDLYFRAPLPFCPASAFPSAKEKKRIT